MSCVLHFYARGKASLSLSRFLTPYSRFWFSKVDLDALSYLSFVSLELDDYLIFVPSYRDKTVLASVVPPQLHTPRYGSSCCLVSGVSSVHAFYKWGVKKV